VTGTVSIPKVFEPLWRPKRHKIFYGGRGGAKSWAFATALVIRGAQQPIRVLCTREYQKSIKESVHRLLMDAINRCGLDEVYEVLDASIRCKNGTMFIFEGLRNNPHAIKSLEGVDVCWCEEAEAITEESWKFLIPTIRKEGSEIWVSFNPSWEDDPTAQLFIMPYIDSLTTDGVYEDDRHYVRKVSFRDNPYFPEVLRDQMLADKAKDHDRYLHVWEGEFQIAVQGAVFAEQLKEAETQGRITNVPIVRNQPVYTFWDLGRNDTTFIVFIQVVNKEMRVIDCYEQRLVDLSHYARMLREKNYLYEEHYLPHDVEVEELGSGYSRRQQLEDMGVRPITVVPRVKHLEDGIAALRTRFPELWIDKTRCAPLIRALKAYSYEWDERLGVHKDKPGPKWSTNPVDALRQWAQAFEAFDPWGETPQYHAPSIR